MSNIAATFNGRAQSLPSIRASRLEIRGADPVMATPLAVLAGVALATGAFGSGVALGVTIN